jgi:hypothetical protein
MKAGFPGGVVDDSCKNIEDTLMIDIELPVAVTYSRAWEQKKGRVH